MKFDKVIMNPPYHIGGKIWDEAVLDTMGLCWNNDFKTKLIKKD